MSALRVVDLRVDHTDTETAIIQDVTLDLQPGQILGVVGESGSGKSTLALALLGYARRGATITSGRVLVGAVDGEHAVDMANATERERRTHRGRTIAFVPQDPATALNPAHRIGRQVEEAVQSGHGGERMKGSRQLADVMDSVGLRSTPEFLRRYPHQLSGGQQQRVAIAMAVIGRPRVLVLDEPTTGLDVTTQRLVLDLIRERCADLGAAAVHVSHDLAAVGSIADRLAVMYAGRVVEAGAAAAILRRPLHPYARRLVAATPDMNGRRELTGINGRVASPFARTTGCAFAPRCASADDTCTTDRPPLVERSDRREVACWHPEPTFSPATPKPPPASRGADRAVALGVRSVSASHGGRQVLTDVSLDAGRNSCVAIVGESGSGKTTLARCIIGLHRDVNGDVFLDGASLAPHVEDRADGQRRAIQHVFQNPYGSLNPRRTVEQIVGQPLAIFEGRRSRARRRRVVETLDRVALPAAYLSRLPGQLSGGERQRVAIARALIAEPRVLVCDEITSALDVSVQASIVNLLVGLQRTSDLTMVFITHNLPLVATIADQVFVLRNGVIAEQGSIADVFASPQHAYTRRLIADTPLLPHAEMERTP